MSVVELIRTIAGVEVVVVTHPQPHLDEIGGLWLAEKFADSEWVQRHCPGNKLELGVGRGEFDEHPDGNGQPAGRVCCLDLVARSLGLEQDQALAQLLKFVRLVDVEGKGQPFDLYNMVKLLNFQHPGDPEFVIRWAYTGLDAKYAEQKDFADSLEAVRSAQRIMVGPADNQVQVMVVESDCGSIMRAAQYLDQRNQPDVVVQRKPTGNTMIWSRQKSRLDLRHVAANLRIAELQARGLDLGHQALSGEGFVEPDKTWYYTTRGEMILNGSNTAEVAPTQLNLDAVIDCIKRGLEQFLAEEETHHSA